ncbi:MAG TPA: hypothetical protein VFV52_18050 [Bacilli bacterium]|nr:hypothetical protein [Bacilli bacterium]
MHVKLTLVMKDGRHEKAHVTEASSVEEAIEFMKMMRPGVVDALEGWDAFKRWEQEQNKTEKADA